MSVAEERFVAPCESSVNIHVNSVVDPSAIIHESVKIGPWAVIGAGAEIGSGTVIHPHVIIGPNTKIGRNNEIHPFSVIGGDPQDTTYRGEKTLLIIGDNNVIREYVTISRGSIKGDGSTVIGNHNFILAYCHIGHDCRVGNHILFTNNATLAGHVVVDDHAKLGAFTAVHQFCRVGSYSFITRGALVNHDVLPYVIVTSHTCETRGLNLIGLQREGFSEDTIRQLRRAYNIIFRRSLKLGEIVGELKVLAQESPEVSLFLDLIQGSDRGFVR